MCFNTFQVLYEAACVHLQTGYYHHKSIETGLYYDLLLVKRAQSSFFMHLSVHHPFDFRLPFIHLILFVCLCGC